MFKFICALVLICLSAAETIKTAIENNDTTTKLTNQMKTNSTYGTYLLFAQSNDMKFKEVGLGGLYAEGTIKYVSPEGENIAVVYAADETGFHPESESFPTPPPIPAYILKAIKYIQDHPASDMPTPI